MADSSNKKHLIDNAQLMAEWDWEKNVGLSPDKLSWCSGKKVWWLCLKGHSYQSPISRRAYGGGCPYCSGRIAIEGNNDLQTLFPDLAEQWHFEKNSPLIPSHFKPKSNKKVWWICEMGHEYECTIDHRTRGDACPYCSNHKVVAGFNDLATIRPDLAKEWHPTLNGDLEPSMISPNGNTAVWWMCSICGFEWNVRVNRRRGCPRCSSKRMTSFPEQAIFYYVSKYFPDAVNRFSFQGYELDVFIPSISTAIEYDGSYYHNTERAQRKDNIKDALCKEEGIRLIRFRDPSLLPTNHAEIIECVDSYGTDDFERAIAELFLLLEPNLIPDISLIRDRKAIEENNVHYYRGNSLADRYPKIAEQWHYEKNKPLDPHNFTPGSSRKVWWMCAKGHEWESTIGARTQGTSCPFCRGRKVLAGVNDLLTVRPDIAAEWDYELNAPLTPKDVTAYSNKRVWWKCSKCQHKWQTSVSNKEKIYCRKCRSKLNGQRISVCAARKNSLARMNPIIAKQWHPVKNGDLKAIDVSCGSGKKAWWICEEGHEWESSIANRVKDNLGCPYCGNQKTLVGYNDFPSFYPNIAKEWNYEKNEGLSPESYVCGSGKKVWWRCSNCHFEWQATIRGRIKGAGCPVCRNNL